MVTAGTYRKERFFNTPERLAFFQEALFAEMERLDWNMQAWAVMSNHYHFIALAPDQSDSLPKLVRALHSKSSIWLNKNDNLSNRKVWFGYWDTCLSFEKSYLARLHYVHLNPVKHGIVKRAEDYPWCSMSWFLNNSKPSFRRTVLSFKTDKLTIRDDF